MKIIQGNLKSVICGRNFPAPSSRPIAIKFEIVKTIKKKTTRGII